MSNDSTRERELECVIADLVEMARKERIRYRGIILELKGMLNLAVTQNSHDMLMTGDELRMVARLCAHYDEEENADGFPTLTLNSSELEQVLQRMYADAGVLVKSVDVEWTIGENGMVVRSVRAEGWVK